MLRRSESPITVSFSFHIDDDGSFAQEIEASLTERNKLVHHFLDEFDVDSIEGTQKAILYLDEQLRCLLPKLKQIESFVTDFYEMGQIHSAYFASPNFKGDRCYFRVVQLLKDIAIQKSRTDGWLPLTTAGELLHKESPNELKTLKEYIGCPSLKKLIEAIGGFEVKQETTDKGAVRTVYRVKPDTPSAQ